MPNCGQASVINPYTETPLEPVRPARSLSFIKSTEHGTQSSELSTASMKERGRRSRPISRVLSRTTIHLGCVSPRTSSDLPGSLHGPCVQPRVRDPKLRASLFGLAPGGVCHATECYHRRGALLPHHFTLTASVRRFGGLFSVALSVDSRPPGVTWRLALGART